MALTIGIIGLPQSGKTTLFNALTKANAPIGGYATSTVQANIAVVQVPDKRLEPLAEIFNPKKTTYTTVEFVDVAGMGQNVQAGKEKREGLSAGSWAISVMPMPWRLYCARLGMIMYLISPTQLILSETWIV